MIETHQPEHVVVKLYQTIETISQDHSRAQLQSSFENGCSAGGYVWLYANVNPYQQVNDALDLAESEGVGLPVLWLDVETYPSTGTTPNAAAIRQALEACELRGVRGGIYSSREMFRRIGNPDFTGVWAWVADYNNRPDLDVATFGNCLVKGHQYTSTPLDLNVFDRAATA